MTEERLHKFKIAAQRRQANLTVILENVHDPHNLGAVLRSCDSVGIKEVFVLYTDPSLVGREQIKLNKRTSSGARRWVDVHLYANVEACFAHVRKNYDKIYSTHLEEQPTSLYELDLTQSVALMFGNEKDGLSKLSLSYSDGNFIIPQMGMVQSLNISVACAVSIYEALRQREVAGMYTDNLPMTEGEQTSLYESFKERQLIRDKRHITKKIS
ncbi:MAG: TrmH family RNA methyltransferase [Saprospiraceae bacterium]